MTPSAPARSTRRRGRLGATLVAAVALATALPLAAGAHPARVTDPQDKALAFDVGDYTTIHVTIDGVQTAVRWYQEVCYVADPVAVPAAPGANTACGYQSMNIFVPEAAFDDPETAIYLATNNGGWFASYVRAAVEDGGTYSSTARNGQAAAALKAGYVYIDVATRSRGIQGEDGSWVGKAPAVVVDAKAAVRYLRLNDGVMPGSADRIVANGTSGGGGLVSILGASGNSRDYLPYLTEIGAAGVDARGRSTLDDDVLAVVAYCPITDLGHADIQYEWLYTTLGTRATVYNPAINDEASEALAAAYPPYQRELNVPGPGRSRLTARTMMAAVEDEVRRSAEAHLAAGGDIPALGEDFVVDGTAYENDWIDVEGGSVVSVDMTNYLEFVATQNQLKPAPSFDQTGVTVPNSGGGPGRGESSLFGTPAQEYSNFTEWSWNHNGILGEPYVGDGVGLDDTGLTWARYVNRRTTTVDDQVRLIDPFEYIGTNADTAPYWYVRHGTRDRDTAFTVSVNLDRALEGDRSVEDVNYLLAWDQPHGGNYDVPEAMAWIAEVLAAADAERR